MFCVTESVPQNVPHIETECEEYPLIFRKILSVPHNIVMNMKNVM